MVKTGQVAEQMIQNYKKLAKDKGRDSWWLAYVLDSGEDERERGKTVELGRAHFQTVSK
jgi:peptide chain release factor subunit 3